MGNRYHFFSMSKVFITNKSIFCVSSLPVPRQWQIKEPKCKLKSHNWFMQRRRPLKQPQGGLNEYLLYDCALIRPNITPDLQRYFKPYTQEQKYAQYLYNLSQQHCPFHRLWTSQNADTYSSFLYSSTYMKQICYGYHSKTNISEACPVSIIR
jgi:hypothetical protein